MEDAVQEAKVLVKWEIQNQTGIPHLSFGREVFSTEYSGGSERASFS